MPALFVARGVSGGGVSGGGVSGGGAPRHHRHSLALKVMPCGGGACGGGAHSHGHVVVNLVMMSPSSSPAPCRRRVNPNLSSRLLHRRRKGRCDAAAAAAAVILGHSGAHFGSCGNAGSGTTQRNPLKIATKGRLAVTSATPSPVCVVDDERYAQITALPEAAALNLPLDEEWHLTVPATSANMGPGFDTLGIALEVLNEVCVRWRTDVDTFEGIDPFTSDPQVTLLG